MPPEYCANLCDVAPPSNRWELSFGQMVSAVCDAANFPYCSRIYLGSYFCSRYFLSLDTAFFEEARIFCEQYQLAMTLVIPIFSPDSLETGKDRIATLLEACAPCLDELTVNDYGMLASVQDYPLAINLGRLFMKNPRDPRYPEHFLATAEPLLSSPASDEMAARYRLTGLEVDPTNQVLDFQANKTILALGIHLPYCFMSTGHICEYAARDKRPGKKFFPEAPCNLECLDIHTRYQPEQGAALIKFGRSVFFENPGCLASGLEEYRIIYAPPFGDETLQPIAATVPAKPGGAL
jgi:hypothetical protein